jgi:hypothetical protein
VKPCPLCGTAGTVTVEPVLVGKPPGTYSIAGVQPKAVAEEKVALTCSACGLRILGHLEDAVFDADRHCFTGGHFIADEVVGDDGSPDPPAG